jgi:hypothetical protein
VITDTLVELASVYKTRKGISKGLPMNMVLVRLSLAVTSTLLKR